MREILSRTFGGFQKNSSRQLSKATGEQTNSETTTDEKSVEDDRTSPRDRTIFRAARLSSRIHNVEGLAIVRNISEDGMQVETKLGFKNGEHVAVSLADGDRIEGEVVWQDGNSFGIKFFDWVSVEQALNRNSDAPNGFKPRAPRIVLDLPIILRVGGYLADAQICDLSQRGAKLKFDRFLPIDTRVQISYDELRPISGSVKWQASDTIGIEFHRILSVEELSSWTGH